MKTPKNCWECEEHGINQDGDHVCKEIKDATINSYSSIVNPYCPLNYELTAEMVYDIFRRYAEEFIEEKNNVKNLNYRKLDYYHNGLKISVKIETDTIEDGKSNYICN